MFERIKRYFSSRPLTMNEFWNPNPSWFQRWQASKLGPAELVREEDLPDYVPPKQVSSSIREPITQTRAKSIDLAGENYSKKDGSSRNYLLSILNISNLGLDGNSHTSLSKIIIDPIYREPELKRVFGNRSGLTLADIIKNEPAREKKEFAKYKDEPAEKNYN